MPPGAFRAPSVKRELAGMFRVLDHVIEETRDALLAEPWATSDEARFDRAVLARALNILEAEQILLPVAHWEAAAGLARQLFELLINVEEIGRSDDPAGARLRYREISDPARSTGASATGPIQPGDGTPGQRTAGSGAPFVDVESGLRGV